MAIGQNPYLAQTDFVKPEKRFWPLKIPISHWQLRHFISHSEPDHLYYASKPDVYCLNTVTKKRKLIAILPFDARCTASGYGWVCVGGEENGHFAAIKLDGSGDVDASLPIDAWPSGRRPPSVKVESIGDEIVNSISIHRIQDEEAHLDDIVAVVTNNDKTVRLYSLPQGCETKVLHLPHPMNHATISPCGTMLVAVGDHNEAFFFTRELNEEPPLIPKPHNRLTSANIEWKPLEVCKLFIHHPEASPRGYFTTAWSPDGQYVAVGSEDGYITLFHVETLRHIDSDLDPVVAVVPSSRADCPIPYVGSVRTMMFSPAPWDLLIWSEDQGRVCVGDLRSGLQRTQVLDLETTEEGMDRLVVEDTATDGATQDEIEQLLQASQRNLEDLESDFLQRYRRAQNSSAAPSYATEYLEARSRQRQQRIESSLWARNNLLPRADDARGLSADEQQILETLRTTRQREEARGAGRSQYITYTTAADLATNRSSASSTPNTANSSTRPINDILNSVQESLPELARTAAHTSRPSSSSQESTTNPPVNPVAAEAGHGWSSRYTPSSPFAGLPTHNFPGLDLRLPRRRPSVLLTPPGSQPAQTGTTTAAPPARTWGAQLQSPAATTDEPDDEQNPWRTIQDAMAVAGGPLFESAAQAPAASPLPPASQTLRQSQSVDQNELAEIQALARRRNRLRNARISLSNVRAGGVLTSNSERTQFLPDHYEMLRRRSATYGRDVGVRTAGLAMSRDGSTLWAACEDGIFEFQMNRKGRMFWPAIQPR